MIKTKRLLKYAFLFSLAAVLLFPIYFMFKGSFENLSGILKYPPNMLPTNPTLKNYVRFMTPEVAQFFFNTLSLAGLGILAGGIVSLFAGYVFAVMDFPGKKLIFAIFMISLFIPGDFIFISRFVVLRYLKLTDSHLGVVLPGAFNLMHIMLCCNYIQAIPRSMIESARMDGAGEWKLIRYIIFPAALPMIASIALFNAFGNMTNFLWQLTVIRSRSKMSLITGIFAILRSDIGQELNRYAAFMAGGVLIFLPILAIFLLGSRFFIKDITIGGEK